MPLTCTLARVSTILAQSTGGLGQIVARCFSPQENVRFGPRLEQHALSRTHKITCYMETVGAKRMIRAAVAELSPLSQVSRPKPLMIQMKELLQSPSHTFAKNCLLASDIPSTCLRFRQCADNAAQTRL